MSIIAGGIERKSDTHELELIKQKKSALQRLIKLTINLNHLNQGLQSILVLGKSIIAIPPKVLNSFKLLSKRLEPLPTDKLQHTLSATEIRIQNNIKQVLEISQKDDAELSDYLVHKEELLLGSIEDSFTDYVTDFKKKAQASIAIRIVLKARDALISAFVLPVPEAFIKKQIKSLDKRESTCRSRIKKEMISIYKDMTAMINSESCPIELKQQLLTARELLVDNINHFNAGKDLESLPIIFESIELSDNSDSKKKADMQQSTTLEPPTIEPIEKALEHVENIKIKVVKRHIINRLWEWITSPMSHSWKDTGK